MAVRADACLDPSPPGAQVLPCATYYKRQGYPLKKIVEYAKNRDFTDLMVRPLLTARLTVAFDSRLTARLTATACVLAGEPAAAGRGPGSPRAPPGRGPRCCAAGIQ